MEHALHAPSRVEEADSQHVRGQTDLSTMMKGNLNFISKVKVNLSQVKILLHCDFYSRKKSTDNKIKLE